MGIEMDHTVLFHSQGLCIDPLPGVDPNLVDNEFKESFIAFLPDFGNLARCSYVDKNNSNLRLLYLAVRIDGLEPRRWL